MDAFMDKIAQKRNAQGIINANAAADAAKMEMLQKQVAEYELLLQEMRKVNLRNVENVEQMQKALRDGMQKMETFQNETGSQMQKQAEEFLAQTGRQAEELRKQEETQTQELQTQMTELLENMKKQMEEAFGQSDDFFHKESVKVYRNVQASMTEELEKQTDVLLTAQREGVKKHKALLPISIITLLLLLLDTVMHVMTLMNFKFW